MWKIKENPTIFSKISRESRDFRDILEIPCSEKTPFVMTPFSGPDFGRLLIDRVKSWQTRSLVDSFRSHSGTLALKTEDFSKTIGSKTQKMDLLKPPPGQKTLENKDSSALVNPFSHFTKTTDFLLKFSVLRAGVLK